MAREEVRRHSQRIRALREITLAISSTLDLKAVLNILLEKIDPFFPYPRSIVVRLVDSEE
jgi:hypothetical protein